MIPPYPPEMDPAKHNLAVEYISILAQAQKLPGIVGLEKYSNFLASMSQLWPEASDRMDADAAAEEYGSAVGVSPRVVRDIKVANQIRTKKAQDSQAQQQMAMAQQGAQTAQTLSQTPVTDDTALGAMIQRMSGATPA
jgi:hypothetical protein